MTSSIWLYSYQTVSAKYHDWRPSYFRCHGPQKDKPFANLVAKSQQFVRNRYDQRDADELYCLALIGATTHRGPAVVAGDQAHANQPEPPRPYAGPDQALVHAPIAAATDIVPRVAPVSSPKYSTQIGVPTLYFDVEMPGHHNAP